MECGYPTDCGEFTVTPMLVASGCPPKCEDVPMCYPCLPRCPKQVYYCCEKKTSKSPTRTPVHEEVCCHHPSARCCAPRSPPCNRRDPCTAPAPCCNSCCHPTCKPVKTKYIIPCYRYEDGRIVNKLPVSAFKRNGMQDQEHSKPLGTANFLVRCPRDVSIECDVCVNPVKVADPAKVPPCCTKHALGCGFLKKKPIETNQPTVLMRRACEVACGTRARRKPFVVSTYAADPYHEERRYHSEDERGNCCFHFERNKPDKICDPCAPCQPCVLSPECQYTDCVYARPVDSLNCCYYCK